MASMEDALRDIAAWPAYSPTPLIDLSGLATQLGVSAIWYKNEGERFDVRSFKPMGGAYAVSQVIARAAARETGVTPSSRDLFGEASRRIAADITVACVTDGNHGRAVAWAAHQFGCKAVVFMANNVTAEREAAIEALGARVVRSDENHDETGRDLKRQAHAAGWAIISEGANATEPQIAYDTIIGYGALFLEAASQLGRDIPTHVFVQTGVGGFAAAAAAMLRQKWPEDLPQLITVEADNADCVLRSVETGERVSVLGSLDTIMAGLAAGEVSDHAWAVLKHGANACMAIPDDAAVSTMRLLAGGAYGDPPISAGESGVAGLAGAIVALSDDGIRDQLGLDDQSRILTIGTEGVTDASIYRELVG